METQSSLDLLRLFDLKQLDDIQNRLSRITRLGFITTNYRGEPQTHYTGFCDFCSRFRQDGELRKNCIASDAMSSIQAAISEKPLIYLCPCGLMEIAIPIVVNGMYLGGFLCGQARCSDPPEDILRMKPSTNRELFDRVVKEAAADLEKLPVFDYRHFRDIADLVNLVITLLCENKIHQIEHERALREELCQAAFLEKQLQICSRAIQGNDYRLLLQTADTLSRELFQLTSPDDLHHVKTLTTLAKSLDTEDSCCLDIFPIEPSAARNPYMVQLWAAQALDYYYRRDKVRAFPILEPVFSYINQHITEGLTLSLLVEQCSISQTYLSRLFRRCFRLSVTDYIHLRKIQLAKQQLLQDGRNAGELAFGLGYNEPTYLSKVFKRYEGITMQEYRKAAREWMAAEMPNQAFRPGASLVVTS